MEYCRERAQDDLQTSKIQISFASQPAVSMRVWDKVMKLSADLLGLSRPKASRAAEERYDEAFDAVVARYMGAHPDARLVDLSAYTILDYSAKEQRTERIPCRDVSVVIMPDADYLTRRKERFGIETDEQLETLQRAVESDMDRFEALCLNPWDDDITTNLEEMLRVCWKSTSRSCWESEDTTGICFSGACPCRVGHSVV